MKALRLVTGAVCGLLICANSIFAAATNVFFTQFEPSEGYSTGAPLDGQAGWISYGSGGNGIVTNYIAGQGQQAFIGYTAPLPADDHLVVWKPINFNPIAANLPVVNFSVLMEVVDSTNARYDIFRWSIYNTQGDRLFSLDFDNDFTDISYILDGTNKIFFTNIKFTNNIANQLSVTMNFASNSWSAMFNSTWIATNRPITTTNAPLNLGDVDAVWFVNQISHTNGLGQVITTNAPGDNYMLFDNYRITAEPLPVPPAQMQFLGRTAQGWVLLRVLGQDNSRWSVDASTNFVHWIALKTNTISGPCFDHVDMTAVGLKQRFYRARLVP